MARSLAIGPWIDEYSLITGTICCPISIRALVARTHKIVITTEPNILYLLPLEGCSNYSFRVYLSDSLAE
jgi:hypothetical protein